MSHRQVELAAHNNAVWCDTVCRAHGVPGEFLGTVWLNRRTPPPYHSNLVVMSDAEPRSAVVDHIRDLKALPLAADWTVKDSYFDLDLAGQGFGVLFEASWIWAAPALASGKVKPSGLRWSRVTSAAVLTRWNRAWAGDAGNAVARHRPAQFPASLLADPQIVFLAGSQGHAIIAGGIANRTGDVVGLSNVFVDGGNEAAAWAGLVDATSAAFPSLPLLGYERGRGLDLARACGFEAVGPLRVWQRRG